MTPAASDAATAAAAAIDLSARHDDISAAVN